MPFLSTGYCGADLKALCTEAALHALRRRYPQIYSSSDKLQLDVTSIDISAVDFHHAMTKIVPAGQRAITSPSRPLSAIIKPLLQRQLDIIFAQLSTTFPYMSTATATSSCKYGTDEIAVKSSDLAICKCRHPHACLFRIDRSVGVTFSLKLAFSIVLMTTVYSYWQQM